MTDYTDSLKAQAARLVRLAIRKASERKPSDERFWLTHSEAAILTKVANIAINAWPKQIHPGHARLAKDVGLSEATICRAMRKFERLGFLTDVCQRLGGWAARIVGWTGKATRTAISYTVDLQGILRAVWPWPPEDKSKELALAYFARRQAEPADTAQEAPEEADFSYENGLQNGPPYLTAHEVCSLDGDEQPPAKAEPLPDPERSITIGAVISAARSAAKKACSHLVGAFGGREAAPAPAEATRLDDINAVLQMLADDCDSWGPA